MELKIFKYLGGLLLITFLTSISLTSFGQYAHFVESGKIEFEKKVNMFAKLKNRVKDDNAFMQKIYDEFRRTQPQFNTSKATLNFSKDKSVYEFSGEDKPATGFFASDPWLMIKNTIYRDFNTDSVTAVKKVYDEDYVVKDVKQDILWKITNESREIAGYQCKRANGLILDSIYVVAFFAEEIIPSGGPESFSGLPGMILGLALPHENVTWFATKVELSNQPPNSTVKIPRRAKQVTRKEYETGLTEENELVIRYHAHTDKETVINLTNHAFFNLNGEGKELVDNHQVYIDADYYLPVNLNQIPTGEQRLCKGSAFDFTSLKSLRDQLNVSDDQVKDASGFDHTFILKNNRKDPFKKPVAKVTSPLTGIELSVFTDRPGIQFYTGNALKGNDIGKRGVAYQKHSAFCLETQGFPDAPNQSSFPSCLLKPGEVFKSETRYHFKVLK